MKTSQERRLSVYAGLHLLSPRVKSPKSAAKPPQLKQQLEVYVHPKASLSQRPSLFLQQQQTQQTNAILIIMLLMLTLMLLMMLLLLLLQQQLMLLLTLLLMPL